MEIKRFSIRFICVSGKESRILKILHQQFEKHQISVAEPQEQANVILFICDAPIQTDLIIDSINYHANEETRIAVVTEHSELSALQQKQLYAAGASAIERYDKGNYEADKLLKRILRWKEVEDFLQSDIVQQQLVCPDAPMKKFLRKVIEVAAYTSLPILLIGETGTGKELIARMIHEVSSRKKHGAFTILDCSTVVQELSGSEFYGHEKGAFTNALYSRDGAFALADKGTLFLDETGELPLQLQAGLLRVIQEGTYKRVGGNTWRHTDFRLICATNKVLLEEVETRRFRADLYYRIANCVFTVPPLRERRSAIEELVCFFLSKELNCKFINCPESESLLKNYLLQRDYPGNIRELRQLVSQIAMRYVGIGSISFADLPEEEIARCMDFEAMPPVHSFKEVIGYEIVKGKKWEEILADVRFQMTDWAYSTPHSSLKQNAEKLGVDEKTLQNIKYPKKKKVA